MSASGKSFDALISDVRACRICEEHLPLGPRPILQVDPRARILVAGQAPGRRVHESGIPFDDASGDRLRDWMGIAKEDFYDASKIALVPMGFCYPGTGPSGDIPPRSECAELWHSRLLSQLKTVRLTLVIGQYAHKHRLAEGRKTSLTKTVEAWEEFTPANLPLPHPSPRNNRWLKKNPWFESDVVPYLQQRVKRLV